MPRLKPRRIDGFFRSAPQLFVHAPTVGLRRRGEGDLSWQIDHCPPEFLLTPADPAAAYPEGWVLLDSKVVHRGTGSAALLIADTGADGTQTVSIPVPVTRKGTVHELLHLPGGIRRLRWQPTAQDGELDQYPLTITPVSPLERIFRMYRRVVPLFARLQRTTRIRAGLTWWSLVADLRGAYRIAGQFRAKSTVLDYQEWIERHDDWEASKRLIRRHMERFQLNPHFVVLLVNDGADDSALERSLESLARQLYRNLTVYVLDRGMALSDAADPERPLPKIGVGSRVVPSMQIGRFLEELASSEPRRDRVEYLVYVRAGDELPGHALYWFAAEIEKGCEPLLLYADHDEIDARGRRTAPRFKPDWSPELLRSTNYIGAFFSVRRDVWTASASFDAECHCSDGYGVLLRVIESIPGDAQIVHVPSVLCHRRGFEHERGDQAGGTTALIEAHLRRQGVVAQVRPLSSDTVQVAYAIPDEPPPVSIVVPTRDGVEVLQQCVESVLEKSTYPRYELVVVDNGSTCPRAIAYLSDIATRARVRVLRYDRPFNFSAINNFAAGHVTGDLVCLLNNDTEVISPGWIEELVGHALQNRVGVVGAKLYYPDGRVQHGGDVVGPGGCANHFHSLLKGDDPGYCSRAVLAQDLSAVTAACLLTWKELYMRLGGLNELDLPVAFNDVDYCLRVREAGYRVVWTPHAELYHHESLTRGADDSPEKKERARREVAYMRRRWKHVMQHDPFYNPNLSYERPDFSLSHAPKVRKPWTKA